MEESSATWMQASMDAGMGIRCGQTGDGWRMSGVRKDEGYNSRTSGGTLRAVGRMGPYSVKQSNIFRLISSV